MAHAGQYHSVTFYIFAFKGDHSPRGLSSFTHIILYLWRYRRETTGKIIKPGNK